MLKYVLALLTLVLLVLMGLAFIHFRQKQDMVFKAESYAAREVYTAHIISADPLSFTEVGVIKEYQVDRDSLSYTDTEELMVTIIVNQDQELSIDFELSDQGDGTYSANYFDISPKLMEKLEAEVVEAEVETNDSWEEQPTDDIIEEDKGNIEPEMAV